MKFLFNVGAEKAGTTWLYSYFKRHPEFFDNGKELNIVQRDDLVPTFTNSSDYKKDIYAYFEFVQGLDKVTGDFTHYEGSTENILRLYKEELDCVPVYIMRDPIRRAWSAWNMLGGGDNFEMPPAAFLVTNNYLQCKYKETVIALDNLFIKPLYFFYEDFFTQANIDTICDELDIERIDANLAPVNRGVYIRDIPQEFIDKFCLTPKTLSTVEYIFERFDNVPWNIQDYQPL